MSSQEKFVFQDTKSFMTQIKAIDTSSPNLIIGGHYILYYEKEQDKLNPLISSDLNNPAKEFAIYNYKEFPETTFEITNELIKLHREKGINSQCYLLANDHIFQSKIFQKNIEHLIKNRGRELRLKYYTDFTLPSSFKKILEKYDLDNSIFYGENMIHSEKNLMNRFEHRTRKQLINNDLGFYEKKAPGKKSSLYFQYLQNEICLSNEGVCSCSGEVYEIIRSSIDDFQNITFIVPHICFDKTVAASEAYIYNSELENLRLSIVSEISDNFNATSNNLEITLINLSKN